MPVERNRRISDVRDLKALAHPLRVRLYYALSAERAATATRLAQLVSESPALVSYHLRQLATHGFVEEAPDLVRDQRERWWRPATRGFSWSATDFDDAPENRAVAATVKRLFIEEQVQRLLRFEDEQPSWGAEWMRAAFGSDSLLRLTAAELTQLYEELHAVVTRWVDRGRAADAAEREHAEAPAGRSRRGAGDPPAEPSGERREHVMVLMHGFPFRP
jgi:DNA-binding transcriptional ArsR family regulator